MFINTSRKNYQHNFWFSFIHRKYSARMNPVFLCVIIIALGINQASGKFSAIKLKFTRKFLLSNKRWCHNWIKISTDKFITSFFYALIKLQQWIYGPRFCFRKILPSPLWLLWWQAFLPGKRLRRNVQWRQAMPKRKRRLQTIPSWVQN